MNRNVFEHLRICTHVELGEHWMNYPVLQEGEYENLSVWVEYREDATVLIGQQEGAWVCGVRIRTRRESSSFNPGLKWGKFASKTDAILYGLGHILRYYSHIPSLKKAALEMIEKYRQPSLFDIWDEH
ncbi:MAG: hypothetical protein IKY71_07740 [Bacteroidaceae bacterium]|nr:hypothetical protein [Bacteroidaceae bacterium]